MSIALTSHKVAAAAVGVAMIFSFAFVTPASAQTVEELTAQINSLLSTITSLQAQLSGMGGTTTTTGGSYNFTLSHKLGDNGGDVMNIQKFLNAKGFVVSTSGAGSAGNESSYFGAKTKAAVIAFQNANAAAVLAPVGLSAGTGYWGASSRAYANSLGGGTTTTPTTPTGVGLTVAAAAQPANSLAPTNAANVPFTKFSVTNNSGAAQTVTGVTVELGGLADKAAFSSVVLLDENGTQVGNTRILNSNKQATIGESMVINAGQTRTFTVAGNIGTVSTTYAGQVATLSVVGVNTSAAVAGSLPITGAAHTFNGSLAIGSATVIRGSNDPGADDTSEEIGSMNYTFTALKVTAGSAEAVRVHSFRFNQSGSAAASDLSNVRVVVDGVDYNTAVSADGKYYTANFGSGIVIDKGLNKEFVVKGNIVGGTNRTVAFDVYKATDINVTGETYGYGITADDGNPSVSGAEGTFDDESTPAYNGYDVTISAGTLSSVSKSNTVAAGNIATQVSDSALGAFQVSITGESVTVQTVKLGTQIAGGADASDLTNVTLVDQNGAVLAGPVDGAADGFESTGDSTGEGSISFNSVTFPVGTTVITVKGQLSADFSGTDTVQLTTNPADWTSAIGDITGDTVTLGSSLAVANTQTVKAAALVATTLSTPSARSVVKGTINYVWAEGLLDAANSGEDVKVTTVVIEDVTSAASDVNDIQNVEIWANLTGGSTNDSTRGDVYETKVSDTKQFATSAAGADVTLSFTLNNQITVAKNTSVGIAVVAALSSSAVGTPTTDTHTIDFSSVTASGVTTGIDATDSSVAGGGQAMTIASNGALTVSVDSSSPVTGLVLDNTTGEQTLGVFRLAASNVEDFDLDELTLTDDGTSTGEPVSKYVIYNGTTKVGEVVPTAGTATVYFNDGQVTVPADGYVLLTVKGVMNNIATGGIVNGNTVQVTIAAANTDVVATGKGSGATVNGASASYDAAVQTIYEAYPVFAFDNSNINTTLSANSQYKVGTLKISAMGDKDVTFNTAVTQYMELNFAIASSTYTGTPAVVVKDSNGTTLDTTVTSAFSAGAATTTIDFNTQSLAIPAGGSKSVDIFLNTTGLLTNGTANDWLYMWLDDNVATNLVFGINNQTTGTFSYGEADFVFKGDPSGPTHRD